MARRRDIEAMLRLGVKALRGISGLVPMVLATSGVRPASLGSRAGWDAAFAEIRERHPCDAEPITRLTVSAVPTRALVRDHDALLRLLRACPGLPGHPGLGNDARGGFVERIAATMVEGSATSVHAAGIRAFVGVRRLAVEAGLDVAAIVDPMTVARLVGVRRSNRPEHVGIVPWDWHVTSAYALADPQRDVVAMAHARGRATGVDVPVVVLGAFASEIRRAAHPTGVRLARGRAWHRDPAIAAGMDAAAREWCRLQAAWCIDGLAGDPWRAAFLRSVEGGVEAYVMASDGTVTRHEAMGHVLAPWLTDGLRTAATSAMTFPALPCDAVSPNGGLVSAEVFGLRFTHADDPDQARVQVCDALAHAVRGQSRASRISFAYRVRSLARGLAHRAAIAFEARADPDVLALANLALVGHDNVKREGEARKRLLGMRVHSLALVSQHRDRVAVLAAARRVPHLACVAGCRGQWRGASDLISAGAGDNAALAGLAADHAGWPAGKAIARLMRNSIPAPDRSADQDPSMVVAEVAATMAAIEPSRPVPSAAEATCIAAAFRDLGLSPPRADPFAAMAAMRALAGMTDAPDAYEAAYLIRDLWAWFGTQAGRVGLDEDAARALREASLLPEGRDGAALARISDDWHRKVGRQVRERNALLGILLAEERLRLGGSRGEHAEDYPGPFASPFEVDGVEVVPLRDATSFDVEGEVQSSCVASYGEDARVGGMSVLSLRSPLGRSTAGHRYRLVDGVLSWRLQEHAGDQSKGHARSRPPKAHVDALAKVERLMSRDEGPCVPGWRARLCEARRLHGALKGFVDERALTGDASARLLDLDLAHLRPFLSRASARLGPEAVRSHADALVADRKAALAALRAKLGVALRQDAR